MIPPPRHRPLLFIVVLLIMLAWTTATHVRRCMSIRAAGPRPTQPYRIDLNTADASTLDLLPGIGPVTAQRIVQYRQTHGPIIHLDQLEQIRGIASLTRQKVEPWVDYAPPQYQR